MLTELPVEASPELARSDVSKMEKNAAARVSSESQFSIKRVTFRTLAPLETGVLIAFSQPEPRVALLEELSRDVWPDVPLAESADAAAGPDFHCVFIHSAAAGPELVQRAERWIDPEGVANASIRIKITAGWARARPGCVLVCAPADEWNGIVIALADFYFYEFELRKLEREIAADWTRAEADLSLANDVSAEDLNRLGEIGVTTQAIWMRRIRLAKLERPLAKCGRPLPLCARKCAARLRLVYDVGDRIETLDGQIEVYEYIYEMANQRMGEYGNFRKEYLLEIAIVFLLAAELCVMILDFLKNSRPH